MACSWTIAPRGATAFPRCCGGDACCVFLAVAARGCLAVSGCRPAHTVRPASHVPLNFSWGPPKTSLPHSVSKFKRGKNYLMQTFPTPGKCLSLQTEEFCSFCWPRSGLRGSTDSRKRLPATGRGEPQDIRRQEHNNNKIGHTIRHRTKGAKQSRQCRGSYAPGMHGPHRGDPMQKEHRCSSTEGEYATEQERPPLDNDQVPWQLRHTET